MLGAMPARTRRKPAAPEGPRQRVQHARRALYREMVLEAAEPIFARRGVEGARMEEIAEAAGLSLGTVYAVFRGKAEIVDALHEARLRDMLAAAEESSRMRGGPLELLLAAVRAYVGYFLAHPEYLRMYLAEGTSWGVRAAIATHPRRTAAWSEGIDRLARLFEAGMRAGVFVAGDADQAARVMIAVQQVQLADWLEGGMRRDPRALVAEIGGQIRRSFCTEPHRPAAGD